MQITMQKNFKDVKNTLNTSGRHIICFF